MLPLVWLYLTSTRIRHAPLFAIVTVWALADLFPYSRCAKWLQRREFFIPPTQQTGRSRRMPLICCTAVFPGMLFAVAILTKSIGPLPLIGHGWAKPHPMIWPAALLPELKKIEQSGAEAIPIFNEQHFGGFLIYNATRLRVFIDGRCELFGEPFLREYMQVRSEPSGVAAWRKQFGFKAALTEPGSAFDQYFRSANEWELVGQAETATLYVLRDRVVGSD